MSSVDQAGGEVTFVDRGLKNGFGNQAAGVVGSGGEASSRRPWLNMMRKWCAAGTVGIVALMLH